jgi:LPXTG-site transpeptidase (sortase) family protein
MATSSSSSTPDTSTTPDGELAAEVIRKKIISLYGGTKNEPNTALEENEVENLPHRSRHQQFMYELNHSGKSQAEIQTAWHIYYVGLPDDEKHQVWQEFYSNQAEEKNSQRQVPKTEKKPSQRTVGQVKKQLLGGINTKGKLKAKHHIQSIIFGLGIGAFAVLILLFGLFNERVIAPFVTPSRTVTNTPIISNGGGVASNSNEVIIPKINVEIPVVYDQASIDEASIQTSLQEGVVHYATTSSPGEQGNAVIFGHSSNNILNKGKYKFAFVLLNRLQIGDTFTLTKDGKRYVYQVYIRKIVKPTDVSVLGPTDKPATATLITCDPPGTALNRLVVVGEQISPSPSTNAASTAVKSDQAPSIVPSDSPTIWQRIKNLFS